MNSLKWAAAALILATAGIHLYLAVTSPEVAVLFTLNALGYVGLGAALLAPFSPLAGDKRLRWALIAYTALTVILYVVFSIGAGDWTLPLGPINKVIELGLLAVLYKMT